MMRSWIVGGAVFALALSAVLPLSGQDAMVEKRDKKLQQPFLKNAKWITDYDDAMKSAASQNRIIFGYFTRSYAP